MLHYAHDICSDVTIAGRREWLATNGLGGYAMGTIAGLLSRSYHGLLVAAASPPEAPGHPPAARTLLLAKLDERVDYDGERYLLFADQRADRRQADDPWIAPKGYLHLQGFYLEGATPVWRYAVGDALLEKRVWMQPHANTTYVHYRLLRASRPFDLRLAALASYRDHHGNVARRGEFPMHASRAAHGVCVRAFDDAPPFYLLSAGVDVQPAGGAWQHGYHLAVEHGRGQEDWECYCHVADGRVTLHVGDAVTLAASLDASPDLDGMRAYAARRGYEQGLIDAARLPRPLGAHAAEPSWLPAALEQLVLAADQFVVKRDLVQSASPGNVEGRSIIAGYPWFGDWGRDTMISLPGLTLATGRPEIARQILQTFAGVVDRGMIPNRFPDAGETPEYNTIDATLWYVEALRAYHAATGDDGLLAELYPVMQEIAAWHCRGTRYGIRLDPADGLLAGGEPGVQLTWMDAKVDGWVATPRIGKPVEINALWYHTLRSISGFAARLGRAPDAAHYAALAAHTQAGFTRFWNPTRGYCYDVLDGPQGDDPSLRPNQLIAVSLLHSPLPADQAQAVVDVCARCLLTSHGLRSLDPAHPDYSGRYRGDRRTRDAAYHQGTVWGWLMGPFLRAHLRVYHDPHQALSFLLPLLHHLHSHGVGTLSEVFDGDPPFTPAGCMAQAWTVAEALAVWREIQAAIAAPTPGQTAS